MTSSFYFMHGHHLKSLAGLCPSERFAKYIKNLSEVFKKDPTEYHFYFFFQHQLYLRKAEYTFLFVERLSITKSTIFNSSSPDSFISLPTLLETCKGLFQLISLLPNFTRNIQKKLDVIFTRFCLNTT
jgi:hypothetical protein